MTKKLQLAAWGLSIVVSTVSFIAWGQGIRWQFNDVSSYKLFPLFGLLAFSLMWAHYMVVAIRKYLGIEGKHIKKYFT